MRKKKIRPSPNEINIIRNACQKEFNSSGVGGRMVVKINIRVSLVDNQVSPNEYLLTGQTDSYESIPWSEFTNKGIDAAVGGRAKIDFLIYGLDGHGNLELASYTKAIFDSYRLTRVG